MGNYALRVNGGANGANNGFYFQFTANASGYQDLVLSLATTANNNGFTTQTFSYSTDGTNFVPFGTISPVDTFNYSHGPYSFSLTPNVNAATFATASGPNNAPSLTIRDTFTGAATSATDGYNLLDNIQLNGTLAPVPEPSTWIGAALAVVAIGWMQRRRLLALIGIA
jgi:hypothetical protein